MNLFFRWVVVFSFSALGAIIYAGAPIWTFTPNPLTPPSFTLSSQEIRLVSYIINNQSTKPHHIAMEPTPGLVQILGDGLCPAVIALGQKGSPTASCSLLLLVNGSAVPFQGLHSQFGMSYPKFCQTGAAPSSLCYGPNSAASALEVTLSETTSGPLYVGAENGNIYYSANHGESWQSSTPPEPGQAVNSVFATITTLYAGTESGGLYQSTDNGLSWTALTPPAPGQAINSIYITHFLTAFNPTTPLLYVGSENGHIYSSNNAGMSWTDLGAPDAGEASVNGLYVIPPSTIYAGAGTNVMFSDNRGGSWTSINGQPDGSEVKNVFVTTSHIYVNTVNEYVYQSTSLTGGGTWAPHSQTAFTFFVNGSHIYAGTQNGYVYSLLNGDSLGFIGANTEVNSLFVLY